MDTIECINGERRWHLHMRGINYEHEHIAHAWWHIFAWRGPVINVIFCSRAHCAPACDVPIVLIQPAIETSGVFHHYVSEYMRFTWRFTGEVEGSNAGPDPGLFNRGFKMSEGLKLVDFIKLSYLLSYLIYSDRQACASSSDRDKTLDPDQMPQNAASDQSLYCFALVLQCRHVHKH